MSFANKAMLAFWVGGFLGLLSTGIVWHPDEHSTYTGFPVPIGVEVMLPDGSFDCGTGALGWVLNPLAYALASLVAAGAVQWLRQQKATRGRQAS